MMGERLPGSSVLSIVPLGVFFVGVLAACKRSTSWPVPNGSARFGKLSAVHIPISTFATKKAKSCFNFEAPFIQAADAST